MTPSDQEVPKCNQPIWPPSSYWYTGCHGHCVWQNLSTEWGLCALRHGIQISMDCFFIKQSQQSADCNDMPDLGELSDAPSRRVPSQQLDSLIFSEADVFSILRKLDIHKASGSDGMSLRLLKFCAPSISQHLATLFNRSLSSGSLPRDWLDATITPIYKRKGPCNEATNYRRISLLSCTAKVLERLVSRALYRHTENIIPEVQSGYRSKDNTVFQLTRIVHQVSATLAKGQQDNRHLPAFFI